MAAKYSKCARDMTAAFGNTKGPLTYTGADRTLKL